MHNLIRPSDLLKSSAIRRVANETSGTGSRSSHRVHIDLEIRVKKLDFDPQSGQLHVSGTIENQTPYTAIGQHHTLDLELHRNFTLTKEVADKEGEQGWDSVARAQLAEALSPQKKTEAVAVVMQEGLANICLVTPHQTIFRRKVEMVVKKQNPTTKYRKSVKKGAAHDKGLDRFFRTVLDTLLRQVQDVLENVEDAKTVPILLASPGFVAANFLSYITERSLEMDQKLLKTMVKEKVFVVVHSNAGHVHNLSDTLKGREVAIKLKNTKYARETELMNKFVDMVRLDDGKAWYGPTEVEKVVDIGAVGQGGGILLISNSLFRSQDVATRRRWVNLVDRVRKDHGGEVRILSSDHESGKRLEGLGGIAAILTYPLADLDESDDDE